LGVLQAGIGRICVTPPVGLIMTEFDERNQLSKGVHDDLYARALVLDDGVTKLSIVTVDLQDLDKELVAKTRQIVERRTGIKKDNVTIAAIHTHSGPELTKDITLLGIPLERPIEGLAKREYIDSLRDSMARSIAGAVYVANSNLRRAKIGVGKGQVHTIGLNRRDSKEPMDPEVGVIRVDSHEGEPVVVLMNYACHPTVLGSDNLLYTADYPGYAVRSVEAALGKGVQAMFTNGACGNVSTRFTRREQTFKEAERMGSILGGEVVKVASEIKAFDQVRLSIVSEAIELPTKSYPTVEEARKTVELEKERFENLKKKGASPAELRVAYTSMQGAEMALRGAEAGLGKLKKIGTEMQAIGINDSILVAEPGELFAETGLKIKKDSGLENVFVVGYANDYIGYVPTKEAYKEGLYETFTTLLSQDSCEIIQNTALKMIRLVTNK